ncbi:MAG TPA: cytochrome c oxidase subunit II [Candidatus Limnocylindrales bacterium]|nr:cytochrome c oxidase subunit II [Candidatus Limnocylindrales bacterium]
MITRSQRSIRGVVLAAALAILAAGCLPAPATEEAQQVTTLYGVFVAIAAVIALIVFGLATWAILRHRQKPGDPLPDQSHGSLRVEFIWTAIPVLIILGLFAGTLAVLGRVDAHNPNPGVELRVEAFRWGWTFSYPGSGVSVTGITPDGPEAVLPVGEPIKIVVASHDVIHAFFVPVFLFKRDAIPGRESAFDVTIDEPGTYRGQCAEFCGIYHSRMPFSIRAVSRAEFDQWLASQPRASPPAEGSPVASP